MAEPSRMARYDVRNDGAGPYAVFYCDQCSREYRSKPDFAGTIAQDLGRQTASDLLRRVPLFGRVAADNLLGEDPRYSSTLNPGQLDKAWNEVKPYFRECATCHQILCLSDFDDQTGFCREDSPRANEIAQAEAEQAANVVKGIANVFGIGDAIAKASEGARLAAEAAARANTCPSCGAATGGAKFCPECGMKQEARQATCPNCGTDAKGAKFCPECGTKLA